MTVVAASGSGLPPQSGPGCLVLAALSAAVDAISGLPVVAGLGSEEVLSAQVSVLARACVVLERQLTLRMVALEREAPPAADVRGTVTRAGVDSRRARLLRQLGRFTDAHPTLGDAWHADAVSLEQVDIVRQGTAKLNHAGTARVLDAVLAALPGLDVRATRALIAEAVDHVCPDDPDDAELSDHAARSLSWAVVPGGGGIVVDGYLPTLEAGAFTAAIDALVEAQRSQDDRLTPAQRRADALAELVARAAAQGLPTGGGLPASVTLTVSLTEAERVALRDLNDVKGRHRRPRGGSTVGGQPAGDAAVRFGICCAAITPILHAPPAGAGPGHGCPGHGCPGQECPGQECPGQECPGQGCPVQACPGQASPGEHRSPRPTGTDNPGDSPRTGDSPSPEDNRSHHTSTSTETPRPLGSLLSRIAHTPAEPLALGRSVRLATTAQRRALQLRDGGCVIPGCDVPAAFTQPHHVIGWALGGRTDLDSLVSLCWAHHRSTELGYYTITRRHPDQQPPEGAIAHSRWWITPRNPGRR